MTRARAILSTLLAVCALGFVSRTVARRSAVREAEGTTRITAAGAPAILDEHLRAASSEDPRDLAWTKRQVVEHAKRTIAKLGPAADLEALLLATVTAADLPPPEDAPLAALRRKLSLAARSRAPVLDAAARADVLSRLHDAHIVTRSPEEFVESFDRALLIWAAALFLAALVSLGALTARSRSPDLSALALSALAGLTAVGITLLAVAVGALSGPLVAEKAAEHFFMGSAATAILLASWPLVLRAARKMGAEDLLLDGRAALAAAGALLLVLAVLGHGPRGSTARINLATPLGLFQPLELVKLLLVVALAQHLGRHRSTFAVLSRNQEGRLSWLVTLGAPFLFALVALFGSAWGLGDFGTVLVLAPTVALIVIAASGSGVVAALLTSGALAAVPLLILLPWPIDSKVFVRLMAWLVPEANGLPGGDQVALAGHAIASGGWLGSSWTAMPDAIPAGTTDLPVALLIERFGVVALAAFVLVDLALVFAGIAAGARLKNRRAEIRYVPMALGFLIAVQTAVALAGLSGLGPLSGIVTPFLSDGGSAMLVFSMAALLIARFGAVEGGAPEPGDDPLPRGLLIGLGLVGAGLFAAMGMLARQAAGDPARLTDPIPTELADGRIAPRWSALVHRIMPLIEPVPIVDRNQRPMAEGRRVYPYGAALAPLLGIARAGMAPLPGTLEERARATHARFPLRPTRGDLVEICDPRCVSVGVIPQKSAFREGLLARIQKKNPGSALHTRPFLAPDFSALARPLRDGPEAVKAALDKIRTDIPFARATIDADLQADVYPLLVDQIHAAKATLGAIVIRDVDSGEVLVRASGESIDPAQIDLQRYADPKITGPFGALRDFSAHYALPPGSTFKPITALALLDVEEAFHPEPCLHHPRRRRLGMQGNLRISQKDRSGWIADFGIDRPHGALDLGGAIEQSCNVYFAQAGLAIGAGRMRDIVSRIEVQSFAVPDEGGVDLAAAAIGQGKTTMSADQLALAYAAIAGDGATRACPILVPVDGPLDCRPVTLAPKAHAAEIQSALRRVVTAPRATGTRAREPKDARFIVFGKTGTAEQALVRGEGGSKRDHAWFAGWFVGENGRRIAFAIMLARGGTGGQKAAPLAPKLGALLEKHGYFGAAEPIKEAAR